MAIRSTGCSCRPGFDPDMDPAPPPSTPSTDERPAPTGADHRASLRRWLPVWISGVVVVGFAIAVTVSFLGGGTTTSGSGVERLDPNGTVPAELPSIGDDPVGQRIGDLTYTTLDGGTSPLRPDGKPLLLNFWSWTCTPCIKEMPDLDAVAAANAGKVDVLGLAYLDSPDQARGMAARTGVTYPLGRDAKGTLLRRFGGGSGLPYTVLIGRDGTILAVHPGILDQAGFQKLIDTATGR